MASTTRLDSIELRSQHTDADRVTHTDTIKMGFFRQLGLLLWKNFVIQRRKVCVSIFEVALPLLFAVLILIIRLLVTVEDIKTNTTYQAAEITPVGTNFVRVPGQYLIFFAPNTTATEAIMIDVRDSINNASGRSSVLMEIRGFDSESALVTTYQANTTVISYAVIFGDVTSGQTTLPDKLKVTLRPRPFDNNDLWRTQFVYPFQQSNAPRDMKPDYGKAGFLYLEKAVAEAVVRYRNPSADLSSLSVKEHRMPYPPYRKDAMIGVLQLWFPFFLMLSFLLNAIQTTKNIVYEKERKLKESMKLIGLSPAAHWTSWFLTVFIYMTIAVALYSLIFGVSFSSKGPVLSTTNVGLFFVFLLCYAIALIAYCFMISVFVQKANIGAAVAGILYFGFYFPYFFLQPRYGDLTRNQKLGSCILFNMAMSFGGNCIGLYEGTGAGAQWNNFHKPASVDDNFSLLDAMIMLLVDAAIYLIITWYVDNVYPGEFGIAKPFYFPFTKTYWCGSKQLTDEDIKAGSKASLRDRHFEQEPETLVRGITINSLKKVYGSGGAAKTAVAGISMNMYENQITVLLGHNGAGKTTTMSMLTGFIQPTSGTALVNGYDIRADIESVRQNLGLCPQHNILFDSMTVTEHLDFFARLKGCPSDRVAAEVEATIQEVGLQAKRHDQAGHLSGGQKRKLSVGIALIAGSKVVILDEPSSGMDPSARRQIWEVLKKNRAGRTIMLSTHFMDEADVLGDRIAIMAEGVIKCCGTSMFLKKIYGAGYHLVVVAEDSCEVDRVTSVIQQHVAEAELESRTGMELRYLLPETRSAAFPALFRALDAAREQLRIGSYGTSATTMEEVFLKVGESGSTDDDGEEEEKVQPNGIVNPAYTGDKANGSAVTSGASNGHLEPKPSTTKNGTLGVVNHGFASEGKSSDRASTFTQQSDFLEFNRNFTKKTGLYLEVARFRGMFVKKALHTRRNYILSGVQLLLPVIFTILAIVTVKAAPDVTNEPSLTLNLAGFGTTTVPYTDGVTPTTLSTNLSTNYAALFSGTNTPEKISRSAYPTTDGYFLAKESSLGISTFNKRVLAGGEFEDYTSNVTVTSHFNGQPYHARPTALALVLNAVLKTFGGSAFSLEFANYPLPKDLNNQTSTGSLMTQSLGFTIGFCVSFGMSFLIASFVYFLIKERISGAKHLQVVSGVGPKVFWLSNLCWDYINYVIPCLVILPIFVIFDTKAYSERLGVVLLLLLLHGWASLPCMYLIQYLFQAPATGMVIVIVINVITGLATTVAVFVLQIPGLGTVDVGNALDWVFLVIFPNFDLGKSFMDVYVNYDNQQLCASVSCPSFHPCCPQTCDIVGICVTYEDDYLAWAAPGVGRYAAFMAVQGAIFFALVMAVEYQLPQRLWYALQGTPAQVHVSREPSPTASAEDSDVLQERIRVTGKDFASLPDSLVLQDVYRRYGGFVAVDHITVGIEDRTCFGLLGQNGAGKTTTFKMLTGDVMLTGGNAVCMGYDVKTHIKQVQENLGYCPQFDALIDQMTGRETLVMFARLRGVPEENIPTVVNKLIEIMMLEKHAEKQTSQYSGGNKRKLSTALALIGDPPFIMLDEPTTGMDPAARRQLWTVLSRVRDSGRTLVLTSHSMEECDALCTRIAIMVNGQFKCLGTPQHLKTKFAQGYTIIVRVDDDITDQMTEFLRRRFQEVEPATDQQGYLRFQVRDKRVQLADLFEAMEASKQELNVLDYSVHQTTLEQVFLAFTANQVAPKEEKKSFLRRICGCRS